MFSFLQIVLNSLKSFTLLNIIFNLFETNSTWKAFSYLFLKTSSNFVFVCLTFGGCVDCRVFVFYVMLSVSDLYWFSRYLYLLLNSQLNLLFVWMSGFIMYIPSILFRDWC